MAKPPKYVKTVRQLIYWQYAQLIANAAGFEENYGFIVSRHKKLCSGEIKWSSSIRDYENELEKGRICTYCGSKQRLAIDHIIPISRAGVDPRVAALLNSSDNCVCACTKCNSSKGIRIFLNGMDMTALVRFPNWPYRNFSNLLTGSMRHKARLT